MDLGAQAGQAHAGPCGQIFPPLPGLGGAVDIDPVHVAVEGAVLACVVLDEAFPLPCCIHARLLWRAMR